MNRRPGRFPVCAVTAAMLRDRTDTQAPPPAGPDTAPPADPGLIPLTVREIRRLLADALTRPKPPGHAARWLKWRRHQQQDPHFTLARPVNDVN